MPLQQVTHEEFRSPKLGEPGYPFDVLLQTIRHRRRYHYGRPGILWQVDHNINPKVNGIRLIGPANVVNDGSAFNLTAQEYFLSGRYQSSGSTDSIKIILVFGRRAVRNACYVALQYGIFN
jgi:hypothetical protein